MGSYIPESQEVGRGHVQGPQARGALRSQVSGMARAAAKAGWAQSTPDPLFAPQRGVVT